MTGVWVPRGPLSAMVLITDSRPLIIRSVSCLVRAQRNASNFPSDAICHGFLVFHDLRWFNSTTNLWCVAIMLFLYSKLTIRRLLPCLLLLLVAPSVWPLHGLYFHPWTGIRFVATADATDRYHLL